MPSASWAWVPALGLDLTLMVDPLGLMFAGLILGIGLLVVIFGHFYLYAGEATGRFFASLMLFQGAMLGIVIAGNVLLLLVFWEMTSLTSFALVGYHHHQASSRQSAQQALLVTGTGGLALLAGFILLAQVMGTSRISEIVARLPDVAQTPALTTALVLILVGAFTKSAQFPFHFWLPNAMAAPTPVSAYLHSATMVKLGVYLLARLDPGFGEWPLWIWSLKLAGSMTAAWGMVLALRERDLKRILAWSTVATLGTLVTLVGLPGESATVAVGALLLAHALYKAPLFFVAGNIDHGTGTRVIDRLGNLRHAMPWTAVAALLAGASMAGMPLSLGFIAKDVILVAKTEGDVAAFANVANTIFGAIAVAVAGVAAIRVFWRHPGTNETPADAHEGGLSLVAPPLALAFLSLRLVATRLALRLLGCLGLLAALRLRLRLALRLFVAWLLLRRIAGLGVLALVALVATVAFLLAATALILLAAVVAVVATAVALTAIVALAVVLLRTRLRGRRRGFTAAEQALEEADHAAGGGRSDRGGRRLRPGGAGRARSRRRNTPAGARDGRAAWPDDRLAPAPAGARPARWHRLPRGRNAP